ncbi:methyl-accepting chemotaxis protein [Vibrio salinus]|uniref:methyl-accepting chemotaxis protein n=1 Tax=Vibrio salinus TaxID=2899784 RepID=UPI001E2E9B84|nr:methyl-accepting chemotaxis protein [Vibrio salinus]MCE0494643.1 methyl-accepting chemotaxis protein [Vibrio salinus]
MKKLGLKQILLLSVLSLVGISVAISSYISYIKQEENLSELIIDSSDEFVADQVKIVEQFINEKVDGLRELGKIYQDKDLPGKGAKDYIGLAKIFASTMNTGSSFIGFESTGNAYWNLTSSSWPDHKFEDDIRKMSYYQDGRKAVEPSLTEPYPDEADPSIYWISMVQKIKEGMIGADMRLGFLNKLVIDAAKAKGALVLILNQDSTVLASSSEEKVKSGAKGNELDWFKGMANSVINHEKAMIEYTDGQDKVLFSHKIKVADKNWYFVLVVNKSEVFQSLISARNTSVITAVVAIFVSLIVAFFVIQFLYRPILSLKAMIASLSNGEGDLTQRLDVTSDDDLGQIAHNVNQFIGNLQKMMQEIHQSSLTLDDNISQMKQLSENNSAILNHHVVETEQVVTAIEEMNATAEAMATDIAHASDLAQQTNTKSNESRDIMTSSQENISALIDGVEMSAKYVQNMSKETENIDSILTVIGDIAGQTNLLALNAAIEAARAGEQGRGFAVVADEVRNLATRTMSSTEQIEEALSRLLKGSKDIVGAMEHTKQRSQETATESENVFSSLEGITQSITEINDVSSQVAAAAEEQSSVTHNVRTNMSSLNDIVNNLAENGEKALTGMNDITKVNQQLISIVKRFKL